MKKNPPNLPEEAPSFSYQFDGDVLYFKDNFTLNTVDRSLPGLQRIIRKYPGKNLSINLERLEHIDSAGVTALHYLQQQAKHISIQVDLTAIPPHIQKTIETFSLSEAEEKPSVQSEGFWERFGERAHHFLFSNIPDFFYLVADITYWTFTDIYRSRAHRKGEFINQAVLIGVNALPIIALISFLIGLVLALQSAQQLRQFGANMFVADLLVIAMTREMGPLLTAIMIAGRSGSAITSEVAAMVVTEEVDALKTMALNPIRYVIIPKMHASIFTLPLLTVVADLFGILGGVLIGYLYLDLSPVIFYNRMVEVLFFRDIVTGIVKSVIFAGIIVVTGSFYGFRVQGGSEGVGRATTQAVVSAIFLVILADSILGLIFY